MWIHGEDACGSHMPLFRFVNQITESGLILHLPPLYFNRGEDPSLAQGGGNRTTSCHVFPHLICTISVALSCCSWCSLDNERRTMGARPSRGKMLLMLVIHAAMRSMSICPRIQSPLMASLTLVNILFYIHRRHPLDRNLCFALPFALY